MYIYILSFLSQEGFFILSAAQASFSRRPSPALFLFSSALSYLVANIFPESPPPIPPISSSVFHLSLIHISEPTRLLSVSYAVFCLKKKNIIFFFLILRRPSKSTLDHPAPPSNAHQQQLPAPPPPKPHNPP